MKSMGGLHATRPKARLQPSFAAFPPANSFPALSLLSRFLDRGWPLPVIVPCTRGPPRRLRFQLAGSRRFRPDSSVGLHSHRIAQLAGLQLFTKRRHIAIAGVGYHDPWRQFPTAARLVDHFQSQFPFLSKPHLLWNASLCAPLRIVRPTLRQVQTPTQNGGALRAHFVQTDSDLAVGCLAERSRILAFHTHRVSTLLRETGVINHPYRIRLQFLNHPPSQSLPHGLPFPRALPHELLHRLLVAIGQSFGHRLNRLPLTIQQQTAHVDRAPMPTLTAADRF